MKLLIVGGTGAFGSFYASLFKKNGFDVFISSTDPLKGKAFCEKNDYGFASEKEIKLMDIVVISSPNIVAPKMVREFAPKLKSGSILMDFCSVKGEVCKALNEFVDKDIEIISVHPMHGPRVTTIDAQQVVFIPIKSGKKAKTIEDFFIKNGANVIYSTPKEHDEMLSIIQGLTHFSQFVSAKVLKEMEVDLKRSLAFASPNYNLFLGLVSRVVLQNPELYAQIQLSNPNNEKVREAFLRNAKELVEICKKNNEELLQKEIIKSTQEFKDPDLFLIEGDRAVDAQKYFISVLKNNIGKKFLIQNQITHTFHYGVIVLVTQSELVLKEHGRNQNFNLAKIRATTKSEMSEWKEKNLLRKNLDYSILVDASVKSDSLVKALSSIKPCKFELLDEYSGAKIPSGKKSLTVRASFFIDEDSKVIDKEIREFINGIGFITR
jgi:prephenate dehydrogenase